MVSPQPPPLRAVDASDVAGLQVPCAMRRLKIYCVHVAGQEIGGESDAVLSQREGVWTLEQGLEALRERSPSKRRFVPHKDTTPARHCLVYKPSCALVHLQSSRVITNY